MRRRGDGGSRCSRGAANPTREFGFICHQWLAIGPCLASISHAPSEVVEALSHLSSLSRQKPLGMSEFLKELPPGLQWPVAFMAGVTAICYVVSEITGNVSQVDRLWPVLPLVYAAYFALLPLWPTSSFFGILPYLPENASAELSSDHSPRALAMFVLTVRGLISEGHGYRLTRHSLCGPFG